MKNLFDFLDGTQTDFAKQLGITASMLSMCKHGKRKLSPNKARLAEKLTNGAVTKEQLRPDIYG